MVSQWVRTWRVRDAWLSNRFLAITIGVYFLFVGVVDLILFYFLLGGILLLFVVAMDDAHAKHLAAEKRIRESQEKADADPFVRDFIWQLEGARQREATKEEIEWRRSVDMLENHAEDFSSPEAVRKVIEASVDAGIDPNDFHLNDLKSYLEILPASNAAWLLTKDTFDDTDYDELNEILKGLALDKLKFVCIEGGLVFEDLVNPSEDELRELILEFRHHDEKKRKERKEDAFNRNNFQPDFGSISIAKKEKIWQINNACSNCYNDIIDVSFYWTLYPNLDIILLCDKCASEMDLRKEGEVESERKGRRISDEVKNNVWRRDEGRCTKCGSNEHLEFDHIIPHSKGGSNTVRNIQLLCESCNRSKSDSI